MSKIIAALAAISVLVLPLQGIASPSQPAPDANAPQEVAPAAPSSGAVPVPPGSTTETPVIPDFHAVTLKPITVTAPIPYIWTLQKGNSKVLVLGTVYPEPQGLTFIPVSINHAIAQSGAIIGAPWFHFDADINIFQIFSVWHAANEVKYLPDGKHLSDVLSPSDLQQWNALRAQYLPYGDKVERMRPMYAGWKLYDSVLKHSGVAVNASIPDLIKSAADKRGIPQINAQFHWLIKDPTAAAHAFEPSKEADLACFQSILYGIQGVPDSARTLAAAWAVGDVVTMKAYVSTHARTRPCWGSVTDTAVAEQQGLNREQEERKAWLAAFNTAAAKYSVVFTTSPVQDIFKPARQIEWMMQEGYVLLQPDVAQTSAPTPAPASTDAEVPQPLGATGGLKEQHK
jgi:uncharacterized protein YbaP (TraB family)